MERYAVLERRYNEAYAKLGEARKLLEPVPVRDPLAPQIDTQLVSIAKDLEELQRRVGSLSETCGLLASQYADR